MPEAKRCINLGDIHVTMSNLDGALLVVNNCLKSLEIKRNKKQKQQKQNNKYAHELKTKTLPV